MLNNKQTVTIRCDINKVNNKIQFHGNSGISVIRSDLKEKILMPSLVGIKMSKKFVSKNINYSEEII